MLIGRAGWGRRTVEDSGITRTCLVTVLVCFAMLQGCISQRASYHFENAKKKTPKQTIHMMRGKKLCFRNYDNLRWVYYHFASKCHRSLSKCHRFVLSCHHFMPWCYRFILCVIASSNRLIASYRRAIFS